MPLWGGGGAALAAEAENLTTAKFSAYGSDDSFRGYDLRTGSVWEGGVAPALTSPETINTVIDVSNTPNEEDRLEAVARGEKYYYGRTVFMSPFEDGNNAAMYMHSLVGGPWTRFELYWSQSHFPLVITDPSKYEGIFDVRDWQRANYSTLYLQASPVHVPTVNRLCVMGAPNVKSPDGTRSVINEVFAPGRLNVNKPLKSNRCVLPMESSGTIEIMNQPGPLTDLQVFAGTAKLHGFPIDTPNAPAGEPVLHLDATKTESFTTTVVDGVAYVDEWRDADGRTLKAIKNADNDRPRIVTDAKTNLPVVDFGNYVDGGNQLTEVFGQSGMLKIAQAIDDAQEIHVVFRDHLRGDSSSGDNTPQIVGNGLGEWSRDWLRENWCRLFSFSAFCDTPVYQGHVLFNGQTSRSDLQSDFTRRLNVLASSLSQHKAKISYIGAANPNSRQGGIVIGEILVYNRELTDAQRQQTHRYLMNKWYPGEPHYDYGVVNLVNNDSTIEVADGKLAIRELVLPADTKTFVKKGAGTLAISRITPANVQIQVEEGDVFFLNDYVLTTAEPQIAADPAVHFDASKSETLETTENEDGKRVLSVWHDVRGKGWKNSTGDIYTMKKPANVTGKITIDASPTGLPMVNLGSWVPDNSSGALCFYRNGTAEVNAGEDTSWDLSRLMSASTDQRYREGFLVYMKTDDRATALSAMSWTLVKMSEGSNQKFADSRYSYNRLIAGYWTFDGNLIDPTACVNSSGEIHVVAFRGTRPLAVNAFGIDRGTEGQTGGVKIGEVVYYDRALTPQERRDTELYLLRKWKDANIENHPQDASFAVCSARVVHPDEATANVSANVNVGLGETAKLTVKSAPSLVKTGAGTLEATLATGVQKSIMAERGTLKITGDIFMDAAFHTDATDVKSMVYTVDANNQTNISNWGGAKALTWFEGSTPSKPRLTTLNVNNTGHEMPFVDMLDQVIREEKSENGQYYNKIIWNDNRADVGTDAAHENVAHAASMNWPDVGPLEEFHIVLKDKTTKAPFNEIIGNDIAYYDESLGSNCRIGFLRQDYAQILYADWASRALWDGYIGLNAVRVEPTKPLNNDVNLVTFVPTAAITNNFFCFARRESWRIGGQCIGECVAYSKANTAERRAQIERYLNKKWRNVGEAPEVNEFFDLESISVANEAQISFESAGFVKAAAISGNGTIAFSNGGGLRNVSSISLGYRGVADYDTLVIDGAFDVAANGTATVNVELPENTSSQSLVDSPVTVMSATSFENFANFANWQLNATSATTLKNVKPRLRAVAGKGLVLDFLPTATRVIIR